MLIAIQKAKKLKTLALCEVDPANRLNVDALNKHLNRECTI